MVDGNNNKCRRVVVCEARKETMIPDGPADDRRRRSGCGGCVGGGQRRLRRRGAAAARGRTRARPVT
jgi:hypothetical protein